MKKFGNVAIAEKSFTVNYSDHGRILNSNFFDKIGENHVKNTFQVVKNYIHLFSYR